MCRTSSAKPQCTTTFPLTGTVSSSVCTLGMTIRNTSATSSSPSSCRYAGYTRMHIGLEFFSLSLLVLCTLRLVVSCFLGAAAGTCTPGICPKRQREEWCHLCHGLQWYYGYHQTPYADTLCGGEPCLSECLCLHEELTVISWICHCDDREYSVMIDRRIRVIFR